MLHAVFWVILSQLFCFQELHTKAPLGKTNKQRRTLTASSLASWVKAGRSKGFNFPNLLIQGKALAKRMPKHSPYQDPWRRPKANSNLPNNWLFYVYVYAGLYRYVYIAANLNCWQHLRGISTKSRHHLLVRFGLISFKTPSNGFLGRERFVSGGVISNLSRW